MLLLEDLNISDVSWPPKIINLLASVFYDPTYYTIKVLQFLKFYYYAKDSTTVSFRSRWQHPISHNFLDTKKFFLLRHLLWRYVHLLHKSIIYINLRWFDPRMKKWNLQIGYTLSIQPIIYIYRRNYIIGGSILIKIANLRAIATEHRNGCHKFH